MEIAGYNSSVAGFGKINEAFSETGLVPQMDNLIKARGVQPEYLVFDALEWTIGFPTPMRTRYIMAAAEQLMPEFGKDTIFIGVGAHEGSSTLGGVNMTIGLSLHELDKISTRVTTVRKAHIDEIPRVNPDWWTYPYPVHDFSKLSADAIKPDSHEWADSFGFGDYNTDKMANIDVIPFSEGKKRKGPPRRVWEKYSQALEVSMRKLDQLIEEVINRGQSANISPSETLQI